MLLAYSSAVCNINTTWKLTRYAKIVIVKHIQRTYAWRHVDCMINKGSAKDFHTFVSFAARLFGCVLSGAQHLQLCWEWRSGSAHCAHRGRKTGKCINGCFKWRLSGWSVSRMGAVTSWRFIPLDRVGLTVSPTFTHGKRVVELHFW